MMTAVFYLVVLAVLAGGGWFAWQQFGGGTSLFGAQRDQRIGVSEVASIDGKRKLVLVHRDGVEHLIMTGGPIDVVIEQGILPQRRPVMAAQPVPQYEPRLSPSQPPIAADAAPAETQPSPSNFGRLRQRSAQS